MITLNLKSFTRSGCLVPLLLFFAVSFSASARNHVRGVYATCAPDTIIIGGKLLLVERELLYDTLSQQTVQEPVEPKKVKKRRKPDTWRLYFEAKPGLSFDELRSETPGYLTVNQFVGQSQQRIGGMSIALGAQRRIKHSDLRFVFGIGIDYLQGANRIFDLNELNDSLYKFDSPEVGQLDWIERNRFPIGAELDTVSLTLRNAPFRTSWVNIPLGVMWESELSKSVGLRFGAGADLRLLMNAEQVQIIELEQNGSGVINQPATTIAWKYSSFFVSPWVHAGARFMMDRNWWLSAGIRGSYLFDVMQFGETALEYRAIHLQGVIGIEFVFLK